MQIEHISDLDTAHSIWNDLSYNKTLFDNWDFRFVFYKYFNYPLDFITYRSDQGELLGLLPLQFNSDNNYYEFFGGSWMEDNKPYVKDGNSEIIPQLFGGIKGPAHLIGINSDDGLSKSFPLDDYKYQLDLSNYSSYLDYITDKFNKKSQQTYRRKFRKIEELDPQILLNRNEDIEKLIEYNIQTFQDDSSFHSPFRKEIYRDLLNLPQNKYLISIMINNKIEAVCLNIEYNNIFYYLNAGANNLDIPNLGSFIIMQAIDLAIKNKCNIFDALMFSYNWKERWHFNKLPFTKYDKDLPN